MQKIASNGATVTNEFTEGNAGQAIPATVVSADWLNSVQRELVAVVEGAGLTLGTPGSDPANQVLQAIQIFIGLGGSASPVSQALVNNQASPAVVTGFPNISKVTRQTVEFLYSIVRKTDSENVVESGRCYMTWNPATSAWVISRAMQHDDSGVILSMVVDGGDANIYHLNYQTDSLSGASYTGILKITDIKYVNA